MALDCGKIISDFLVGCADVIKGGIEQSIVLINRTDIDKSASVVDTDVLTGKHTITSLVLNTGTTGYVIEGIGNKQIFSAGYTLNNADDQPNDFTHTLALRLFNCTEASAALVNSLALGADLVAVVKNKSGCFEILGYDGGLKVSEASKNSAENKGSVVFTLSSSANDTEPYVPYQYLDTDTATTQAAYDNKFAAA